MIKTPGGHHAVRREEQQRRRDGAERPSGGSAQSRNEASELRRAYGIHLLASTGRHRRVRAGGDLGAQCLETGNILTPEPDFRCWDQAGGKGRYRTAFKNRAYRLRLRVGPADQDWLQAGRSAIVGGAMRRLRPVRAERFDCTEFSRRYRAE